MKPSGTVTLEYPREYRTGRLVDLAHGCLSELPWRMPITMPRAGGDVNSLPTLQIAALRTSLQNVEYIDENLNPGFVAEEGELPKSARVVDCVRILNKRCF